MQLRTSTICSIALLLFLTVFASQSVNAQKNRSRIYVLESLNTKAGVLKLIGIVDFDIGETNWAVLLNGKMLYRTKDDVFGSVRFHTVFKGFASRDAVLMEEDFGPGQPSEFRIIDLPAKGKATVTERFGISEPLITQDGKQITFSFSVRPGVKPDNWIYQNGVLTKQ